MQGSRAAATAAVLGLYCVCVAGVGRDGLSGLIYRLFTAGIPDTVRRYLLTSCLVCKTQTRKTSICRRRAFLSAPQPHDAAYTTRRLYTRTG